MIWRGVPSLAKFGLDTGYVHHVLYSIKHCHPHKINVITWVIPRQNQIRLKKWHAKDASEMVGQLLVPYTMFHLTDTVATIVGLGVVGLTKTGLLYESPHEQCMPALILFFLL